MGACDFSQYHGGADVKEAFRAACEEARHDHGHGGYTGTIAEKHEYIVISARPRPRKEADDLADDTLGDDDSPVQDKWGPAGAIAVGNDATTPPEGWLFFGIASS